MKIKDIYSLKYPHLNEITEKNKENNIILIIDGKFYFLIDFYQYFISNIINKYSNSLKYILEKVSSFNRFNTEERVDIKKLYRISYDDYLEFKRITATSEDLKKTFHLLEKVFNYITQDKGGDVLFDYGSTNYEFDRLEEYKNL